MGLVKEGFGADLAFSGDALGDEGGFGVLDHVAVAAQIEGGVGQRRQEGKKGGQDAAPLGVRPRSLRF